MNQIQRTIKDPAVIARLDEIRKKVTRASSTLRKLPVSELQRTAYDATADAWGLLTEWMIEAGYRGKWGHGIEMVGKHARRTDRRQTYTRRRGQ